MIGVIHKPQLLNSIEIPRVLDKKVEPFVCEMLFSNLKDLEAPIISPEFPAYCSPIQMTRNLT